MADSKISEWRDWAVKRWGSEAIPLENKCSNKIRLSYFSVFGLRYEKIKHFGHISMSKNKWIVFVKGACGSAVDQSLMALF